MTNGARRVRLAVGCAWGLLAVAACAAAADLSWTSLQTVESSTPMIGMPPSTTIQQTISGSRMAAKTGSQVVIVESGETTTVDWARQQYYRMRPEQTLKEVLRMGEGLKARPGYQPPKFSVLPVQEPQPGPTLLGVATSLTGFGLKVEMPLPGASMMLEVNVETAAGKPEGWEAMAGLQGNEPRGVQELLEPLGALLGPDVVAQMMQQVPMPEGFPLRTRIVTVMTLQAEGGAAAPPMSPMRTAITLEVTSISRTADLTLFDIPADFREVPPPVLPAPPPAR